MTSDAIIPVSFDDYEADFGGFAQALGDSFTRYGFAVIGDHPLAQSGIEGALAAAKADLVGKLEQQQQKLTEQLASIEQQLADADIYSAERKAELTALLAKQATASSSLSSIEEDWFMAQDELEQQTERFLKSNS